MADITRFPVPVLDYWHSVFADTGPARRSPSVVVNETLNPKRPAMMLETTDGSVRVAVRSELAERMGLDEAKGLSIDDVRGRLASAGLTLHDPDYLFYLSTAPQPAADPTKTPRQLFEADRDAFRAFHGAASEQDRDDAFVELDHWAVFGCFDGDRLVSAASLRLWEDSKIADLGVLTLPDARGKGFARTVVRSINQFARLHGYEPQYRCQLDNHASVALARACDLTPFGTWIVAEDTIEHGGR